MIIGKRHKHAGHTGSLATGTKAVLLHRQELQQSKITFSLQICCNMYSWQSINPL